MAQAKKQQTIKELAEETALKFFIPVGLVAGFIGYVYNSGHNPLPVLGLHSIGFPIIVAAILVTFIFFAYGYLKSLAVESNKTIQQIATPKNCFDTFALSLPHALLAAVVSGLFIVVLNYAFKGLTLDPLSSSFILGLAAAIIVYLVITLAMSVTIEAVTAVVISFLLVGVLASMLATDNENWWQVNFSYLGTFESGVTKIFNATLVITSLVMLVLVNFLFDSVKEKITEDKRVKSKNFQRVKRLFIIAAISLGGVGLFSYSRSPLFHDLSAMVLAICFGVMMVSMRLFLPIFPKAFYTISYIIAFAMVFGWVFLLNGINYINLTAFELLAAVFCGIWIGLFLRNISLFAKETS
ncbi:MAG TPA: hypothetical protein VLE47_01815 [Candidatus Saccharimonadales bacterium]|nr:hypothetical protein [Candidatus Saccharimonadales bacterium]